MNLTDEHRDQIKLEEIYRDEVRKSLVSKKTRKGQIVAFLNTPFALWILSSILLTVITATWSAWSNQRDKDRAKNERISKMKAEIAYRLSEAEENLTHVDDPNFRLYNAVAPVTEALVAADPQYHSQGPAFPEFEKRTVKSLLIEWQTMTNENKEKSNIADFLETIKKIENTGINREVTEEEKAELIRQVRVLIDHATLLLE